MIICSGGRLRVSIDCYIDFGYCGRRSSPRKVLEIKDNKNYQKLRNLRSKMISGIAMQKL